jgi:ABC-type antimicrobial peptide transport system permease subunit
MDQKYSDAMILYVRSKRDPREVLIPVEHEIQTAGPDASQGRNTLTGDELIKDGLFQARIGVGLLSVFGLLALGLASIGLYGILAYSVNQRKREIGLRMALGAAQATVLRLIVKEGMALVSTGVVIGCGAALVVGQLLKSMLYGTSASDPFSFGGAALVLVVVALGACYFPARRASRVDPAVALREG